MSHTILVVDPPQGACVERVVNTVARLGLALCHVGTAEELIERAAARKDGDPVVAVITDDTPAPLAVAERLCVAAPFAHILFVADKAAAASLGPGLHGSAALQGAHFTVSPPDEEQIAEFLVRALKVPRRLRAATRGGKPPSAVDRILAAAGKFPHMVWSAANDGTIDYPKNGS